MCRRRRRSSPSCASSKRRSPAPARRPEPPNPYARQRRIEWLFRKPPDDAAMLLRRGRSPHGGVGVDHVPQGRSAQDRPRDGAALARRLTRIGRLSWRTRTIARARSRKGRSVAAAPRCRRWGSAASGRGHPARPRGRRCRHHLFRQLLGVLERPRRGLARPRAQGPARQGLPHDQGLHSRPRRRPRPEDARRVAAPLADGPRRPVAGPRLGLR